MVVSNGTLVQKFRMVENRVNVVKCFMVSVAKLVDVPDCDSGAARREGSSPFVHPIIYTLVAQLVEQNSDKV